MLKHGGRLRQAAQRYGLPLADWLDLSTGINPLGWPVSAVPAEAWLRLPEDDDELVAAACRYYGARSLLPVAGSQAAIQALPRLRQPCRVGLLAPSYAEHQHHWRAAGHHVTLLTPAQCEQALAELDVLVIVNPNNPTGSYFEPAALLEWHARLSARGGWLIVDEAFADACPDISVSPMSDRDGLIVLRSLGKFFGLAGARVGFVLAAPSFLVTLAEHLGPWCVTGPSRVIAARALTDPVWQRTTREQLQNSSARLAAMLSRHDLKPSGGTALFQWVRSSYAATIHEQLARCGILVRLFDSPLSVRFGLPGADAHWLRLERALQTLTRTETHPEPVS